MISVVNPFSFDTPQGIILYQCPSKIDNKPIVVIATGFKNKTENKKTGNCLQTWILSQKENPVTAWTKGHDCSICGNCKHSSPQNGGWNTCYVNVFQAPWNVWESWKKGNYAKPTKMNLNLFRNRVVRIGSYGDPSAVDVNVWISLMEYTKSFVGYTHQFERSFCNPCLKHFCMASVDTKEEALRARKLGWRTFRVRTENEDLMDNEIACPASEESGRKTTCEKCQMCSGGLQGTKKNVSIIVHGREWKTKRFVEIMKRKKQKREYRSLIPV